MVLLLIHNVKSCCSVTRLCLTLCNPKDYSKLGSSVPPTADLPEFAKICVHQVSDAI